MASPFQIANLKATSTSIIQGGFRPLLFTVANGSYVSNIVFGSGATEVNNYETYQLPRGTTYVPLTINSYVTSTEGCDFQMTGQKVNFICSVVLNAQLIDPGFGTEELRIRPYPRSDIEPAQYLKPLPVPLRTALLPLFEDVEIVNKLGVQVSPDSGTVAGVYDLQARLLQDGQLALVLKDITTTPPTVRGLQSADINNLFGTADEIIRITIRGCYRAQL